MWEALIRQVKVASANRISNNCSFVCNPGNTVISGYLSLISFSVSPT